MPFSKTIHIKIDEKKITQDIQLVLTFEELIPGDNYEKVAWAVSPVNYKAGVSQEVPVTFEASLAFSLASKKDGKTIIPGKIAAMELQETIDIVTQSGQLTFDKKIQHDKRLHEDQISTWNNADTKVAVTVGFINPAGKLDPAAYIGGLMNKNVWVATYKPNMTLYITSDMSAGKADVISTIAKSDPIHTWELASSTVKEGSTWRLTVDDKDTYVIKQV